MYYFFIYICIPLTLELKMNRYHGELLTEGSSVKEGDEGEGIWLMGFMYI
jgi:hypothetical protein